ncbi:CIR protein [Plasmodium chabaudi adami]|uniref:CIR protein n=1 Tax=Plasmodium chabaudi adami TaxID=5826 RepID=A0A1D3LJU0_PLACE|nr:CIR protein [Plasmodium chabaudi adami]
MGYQEMCETFIVADQVINGENANITMEDISKNPGFKQYCPNQKCETRRKRISALSTYLFMQLRTMKSADQYDEYFLMWLGDKLFKMHNKSKGKGRNNRITLYSAYEKYLKNHRGYLDYWALLNNISGLKEANLEHMHKFYRLLNDICKTIVYYIHKDSKNNNLIMNSTECSNQYMFLYQNVFKCNSYLHLLDNLKKIYDSFRAAVKNIDPKSAAYLQTLTTKENSDLYFAKNFKTFEFNGSGCQLQYDDNIFETLEKAKLHGKQTNDKTKGDDITQIGQMQSSVDQIPSKELVPGSQGATLDTTSSKSHNEIDALTGTKSELRDSQNKPGIQGDEKRDSGVIKLNQMIDSNGETVNSETSGNGMGNSIDGTLNPNSESNILGRSSDPATTYSSVASFDIGLSIGDVALKGMEQLSNILEFFNKNKEKITKTTNTIQNIYSTSVFNIKSAFNESINIFNGIIDHISNQPEKVGIPPILGGNQSESGSSGTNSPTFNDLPTPQKDSSQTSSETSPKPKEQTNALKSSQDLSGNKSFDKNDHLGSQNPVANTVTKSEHSGIEVKENETTGIGGIYILKGYKQVEISIIVLLIPIALAIMHKYLKFGWRKELKKKKNMKHIINLFNVNRAPKTVINPINGKRPMQIIINSPTQKKQIKKSTNSVYRERFPLLNIYKLMQAAPVPFINLFFLLIFLFIKEKTILWNYKFN